MATPTKSKNLILETILDYLAQQGLQCTPEHVAEIQARIDGHPNHDAAAQYLVERDKSFVYKLEFADVTVDAGVALKATLAGEPIVSGHGRDETIKLAKDHAALLNHPVVVVNGAGELIDIVDEPATPSDYDVCRPIGEVRVEAPEFLDSQVADDFDLIDAGLCNKRTAVAAAKQCWENVLQASLRRGDVAVLYASSCRDRKVFWQIGSAKAEVPDDGQTVAQEEGKAIARKEILEKIAIHSDFGLVLKTLVSDIEDPLPHWATGRAKSFMDIGAQLCTKDGRKMGNAVVIDIEKAYGHEFAKIVTDAGNVLRLTINELNATFYEPQWLSDLNSHPGVALLNARTVQDEAVR